MKSLITIEVYRGCVTAIYAEEPVTVTIVDLDSIAVGDQIEAHTITSRPLSEASNIVRVMVEGLDQKGVR